MSSAQFTVGLAEDSRISSKVLKPPGGGSSDIFGTSESSNTKPANGNKKYVASQFSLGHQEEESKGASSTSLDAADGASVSSQTSTSNGTPDNSEPNTPRSGNPVTGEGYNPEEEKKEETPRRQRVPPGGFSSKLW